MASNLYESQYLHGLHDPGGESTMYDKPGWIVHAISLQETNGMDYRYLTDRGFGVICRINWGWHDHGSIPDMFLYEDMAKLSFAFVRNTKGCNIFIVGNEFNRIEENRGSILRPEDAATCHKLCFQAIKKIQPDSKILVAAVAPWDNRSGDWLDYQARLVVAIDNYCDGYALHAYTHGSDPQLVYSLEEQNGWYWHFSTYLEQIRNILSAEPTAQRREFHITEVNQGDNAWANENRGFIKNCLSFAHSNNQRISNSRVRSVSFYRWKNYPHDKWGMEHLPAVVDDFRQGAVLAYPSPLPPSSSVLLPSVSMGNGDRNLKMAPSDSDLQWDPRLTDRGVKILPASNLKSGDVYWKITQAIWLPEGEGEGRSGGRHHIYVAARNPIGEVISNVPFKVVWPNLDNPDGFSIGKTKNEVGINGGNYPMSGSLNDYHVKIDDRKPSEILSGIGMGADGNKNIHTSTVAEWTLTQYLADSGEETPGSEFQYVIVPAGARIREGASISSNVLGNVPYGEKIEITGARSGEWFPVSYKGIHGWTHDSVISDNPKEPFESPPPAPRPPEDPPAQPPAGSGWDRVRAFTRRWEGGYQNLQWDAGNWTGCEPGKGENKGTNYGISACSYPHLDIRNLTLQEAEAIFFRDYWLASGADKLSWPLNLLVYDTAVNFHPTTAKKWLAESNSSPIHFIALRLRGYRKSKAWPQAGNAWVDRVIDLMLEASKL